MIRKRTFEILEAGSTGDRVSLIADIFLITLISLNVLAIVLESVESFQVRYSTKLLIFEIFSVVIFTFEYLGRVWSCVEDSQGKWTQPVMGRIRYMLTPSALIDLIAILPFYLSFFLAIDLRFLRVVRLLRIFKLTRYSAAMQILLSVLREESRSIIAAFFVLFILLILASSGVYLIEHDVQPEAFGNIPSAMWWAMATLTTVGYGDVTPITPWGKFFGGFITLIGMGMVALPTGILASGFADHMHRRRDTYRTKMHEALSDGVLTEDEKHELEELQKKLDLSDEDTNQLFQVYHQQLADRLLTCPHCGKSLQTDNR